MTDQPATRYAAPSPDEPGSLALILRRRWLALSVLTAVMAASAGFALGLPELYRASATLLVQGPALDPFGADARLGTTEVRLAAIRQYVFSRAPLNELVSEFNLYPELRRAGSPDALLRRVERDVSIDPDQTVRSDGRSTTVAFTVSYIGADPETVAAVTNRLSEFYAAQNDDMLSRQAARATARLDERLADTRRTLDSQVARLQASATDAAGARPDANLVAISRIDGDLRASAAERARLIERRQTLRNQIAELASSEAAARLDPETRLARLRRDVQDLSIKFSDQHPDIRQRLAEIKMLEAQSSAAGKNGESATSGTSSRATLEAALQETVEQLEQLDVRSAELRRELGDHESRVQAAAVRAPKLQSIAADLDATREVYDSLQQRRAETQLNTSTHAGAQFETFAIVDPAVVPTSPAGPNRWSLLLLGLIVGVVAAGATAMAADRLDTSFRSVDELRQFSRVPVLVSVPTIQVKGNRLKRAAAGVGWMALATGGVAAIAIGAFFVGTQSVDVTRILLRVG